VDAFDRLNRLVAAGPFHVEVGKEYRLDEVARAHREIEEHHLGKIGLRLH
jgi:NADPH:quinone reductase-like Zn-dependent oxidoreductase